MYCLSLAGDGVCGIVKHNCVLLYILKLLLVHRALHFNQNIYNFPITW